MRAALLFTIISLASMRAEADGHTWFSDIDIESMYFYTSMYTTHYDPDPDHVNDQNMLGIELETDDRRLFGLSLFDNSFGQKSQYLYTGYRWERQRAPRWLYFKLTGGLLHGYRDPYEDKIPFNDYGVAPAIVPSVGISYKNFNAEFSQLGLAAGMVTAGFTF